MVDKTFQSKEELVLITAAALIGVDASGLANSAAVQLQALLADFDTALSASGGTLEFTSGTYTGNGANNRLISTGIPGGKTIRLIVAMGSNINGWVYPGAAGFYQFFLGGVSTAGTTTALITGNDFRVGAAAGGTNLNAQDHRWTAFFS